MIDQIDQNFPLENHAMKKTNHENPTMGVKWQVTNGRITIDRWGAANPHEIGVDPEPMMQWRRAEPVKLLARRILDDRRQVYRFLRSQTETVRSAQPLMIGFAPGAPLDTSKGSYANPGLLLIG